MPGIDSPYGSNPEFSRPLPPEALSRQTALEGISPYFDASDVIDSRAWSDNPEEYDMTHAEREMTKAEVDLGRTALVSETIKKPELDVRSNENITRISESFLRETVQKGMFPTSDDAADKLRNATEEIDAENKLTINMSGSGIEHFLSVGKLEPASGEDLATSGKAEWATVPKLREDVDRELIKYVAGARAEHPTYAALAGPKDKEMGAAPSYGAFFLELDSEKFADKTVFHFSDSLATQAANGAVEDGILDSADAHVAKAMVDLIQEHYRAEGLEGSSVVRNADNSELITVDGKRPGYVEAAIFDEITPDKVKIGVRLGREDTLHQLGNVIKKHPEAISRINVHHTENTDEFVSDWLKVHGSAEKADEHQQEAFTANSGLWQELGLNASASFEDVKVALQRNASLAMKDLADTYVQLPRVFDYKDEVQWDGYIKQLRAVASNYSGEARTHALKLIKIQKARVFFSA